MFNRKKGIMHATFILDTLKWDSAWVTSIKLIKLNDF